MCDYRRMRMEATNSSKAGEQLRAEQVEQLQLQEGPALRTLAFCGVAISTVATLVCVLAVPMAYNYMQHVHAVMQDEVDFCKQRVLNVWKEVTKAQVGRGFFEGLG